MNPINIIIRRFKLGVITTLNLELCLLDTLVFSNKKTNKIDDSAPYQSSPKIITTHYIWHMTYPLKINYSKAHFKQRLGLQSTQMSLQCGSRFNIMTLIRCKMYRNTV